MQMLLYRRVAVSEALQQALTRLNEIEAHALTLDYALRQDILDNAATIRQTLKAGITPNATDLRIAAMIDNDENKLLIALLEKMPKYSRDDIEIARFHCDKAAAILTAHLETYPECNVVSTYRARL